MRRALVCGLLATALVAADANADTFTVRDTADTDNPDGCTTGPTCSLREAINAANAADGNVVSIPQGTFELSAGHMIIAADMTITGAGARGTVIDANGGGRVFTTTSDIEVVIENLTVTGGQAPLATNGGGIYSEAAILTLRGVAVTGNTADVGGGGVTVGTPHSSPGLNSLVLERTTISGNRVEPTILNGQGGGVMVFGNLTATNSTIANNVIEGTGLNLAQGGGVISASGDIGGGDISGDITLVNTTIVGNRIEGLLTPLALGGGLSGDNLDVQPFESDLLATNTIIAGNTVGGAAEDCALINTTSSANNLSSDATCGFGDAGSKQSTAAGLGELRNNGGPTDTLLPSFASAAVNTGTGTGCPATDQRGVARPQIGACDIGAVELAPPGALTGGATDVALTTATIGGAVDNPHVDPGGALFEFGTSTAYGQTTTLQTIPAGAAGVGQSASLSGLSPGTTYHYRVVAANNDGVTPGADATFRTAASTARLPRPRLGVAGVRRSGCVARGFTVRVNARAASGTRIRSVRVRLDGRLIKRSSRGRFRVRIKARRLSPGPHTLGIKATDRRGRSRTVRRTFTRCAPARIPRFTG